MLTRIIFCFSLITIVSSCSTTRGSGKDKQLVEIYDPANDFEAIKEVMSMQERAWSNGDVEEFMEGYIKDESLTFIGSRGLSYGWETTLANYKKGYPDKAAMGKLSFEIIELKSLSPAYCYMIGQYFLTRESEDMNGYFTLLWHKVDGQWKVIADQTCG